MEFMQSLLAVIIIVEAIFLAKQERKINRLEENAKDDNLLIVILTDIIRNDESN